MEGCGSGSQERIWESGGIAGNSLHSATLRRQKNPTHHAGRPAGLLGELKVMGGATGAPSPVATHRLRGPRRIGNRRYANAGEGRGERLICAGRSHGMWAAELSPD